MRGAPRIPAQSRTILSVTVSAVRIGSELKNVGIAFVCKAVGSEWVEGVVVASRTSVTMSLYADDQQTSLFPLLYAHFS